MSFRVALQYFTQPLRTTLDFRQVRLGDLLLVKEVAKQNIVESRVILHKRTGAVKHRLPVVVGPRKIHQVRVIGFQEDFTAVVYEGSDVACAALMSTV